MWKRQTTVCLVLLATSFALSAKAARVAADGDQFSLPVADPRPPGFAVESSTAEQQANQGGSSDAFGDYYYQDELVTVGEAVSRHHGFGHQTEQRNTYVLEDSAGRISVVEQESSSLPGGGVLSWVRQTAPGSESVTMVSASRSSSRGISREEASPLDASAGSFSLMQTINNNVLGSSLGSVFAPLNDLLAALEAQQQQLMGKLAASAHRHVPMRMQYMHQMVSPQYTGLRGQHTSVKPCPMHQARMAAAATAANAAAMAAAMEEQQQQQREQQADFWEQFAAQQHADMQHQVQHARLQSLLEEDGLSLVDGVVLPLQDTVRAGHSTRSGSEYPDLEDVYDEYVDASAGVIVDDRLYDATGDYYILDGPSMFTADTAVELGVDQTSSASWYKPSSSWWSAISPAADVDLDLALLVLLVACTAGMCIAFLQSLLQLRDVLQAQPAASSSSRVVRIAGMKSATLAAMAAGCCCRTSRKGAAGASSVDEGLTQPLLEQQQPIAATAAVQTFHNPLCCQRFPGNM